MAYYFRNLDCMVLIAVAVAWEESYLSDRKQCVSIDSCPSQMLPTNTVVPQGSILGPILYILFTNELPDIVQEHLQDEGEYSDDHVHQGGDTVEGPPFTVACTECGSICCHAVDTTYSTNSKNPQELTDKLLSRYRMIAEFMLNNRLTTRPISWSCPPLSLERKTQVCQ